MRAIVASASLRRRFGEPVRNSAAHAIQASTNWVTTVVYGSRPAAAKPAQ